MKKTFKRLGAVLLAAFMLLSTTICALAVEGADASTTSDTITLNVSGVSDGDTVYAYRLVEYNKDGNGYKFFDGDDTKKGFETYIKSQTDRDGKTAEKYLADLNAAGVNKLLEGYAAKCKEENSEYTLPSNRIDSGAVSNNTASLKLEAGYYLLLTSTDTKNNRIYTPLSAFIKKDGENLAVYAGANSSPLKAESDESYKVGAKAENGPTIDKKTNATKGAGKTPEWKETAAAGVNDIVRFYVEVNIPKYNNVSALNLTVNDTLTNLKYKENTVKVYTEKPELGANGVVGNPTTIDGAIKNSEDVVEQDYTTSNGAGTQKLKFELDYQKIMGENAEQSKTVYIYYEAIMQKEAVTGTNHQGENVATLKYSNAANPNIEYTTDPEDTDVFTYYIGLTKKKNKTDDRLKGAYFSVYTEKASDKPLEFVKVKEGADTEYYRLAVAGEEGAVKQIEADFQIRGLDANTYYLEEVVAPQGYTKPSGRFEITMTSQMANNKHTGTLDNKQSSITALNDADAALILSSGVSTEKNYQFSISLGNFSTPNLPTTGGTGTVLLSIGGVVLMAAGAYLLFFRKKKEN